MTFVQTCKLMGYAFYRYKRNGSLSVSIKNAIENPFVIKNSYFRWILALATGSVHIPSNCIMSFKSQCQMFIV